MSAEGSTSPAWYRSGWAVLAASLLFPPLGLILLWTRARPGMLLKLLASLGIAALGLAHLVVVYGMRVELDGTGMRPLFSFHTPERDFEALERHRAAQARAAAPMPAPAGKESDEVAAAPASVIPPTAVSSGSGEAKAGTAVELRAELGGAYWTDFRGPLRDGHYTEMPVNTAWPSEGLKPLYKQPIGGGYASFVIAQGRAFTIEQRREKEYVVAYELETGRELWTHSYPAFFRESMGGDGPRATPTWHDGRIYSLGATGELRCLDAATGKVIWAKNILTENQAENLHWGMAASPLVVDDKVIVLPGGRGASVVAYDRLTGAPVWKALDDPQAYTAPMVATLAGQRQLLVVSRTRLLGLRVEDGGLLWHYPWVTEYGVNAAQPIVVDGEHVAISAGYDHGAALLRITREGDRFAVREIWKNNMMKNRFSSSVLYEGRLYGFDESILACVDIRTGQRKWKGGRYGYGQVLLASGHLIITTEQGELVLVRATPERHEELARFPVLDGKTWNVPAIGNGILLVRNTREMAAFRIGR